MIGGKRHGVVIPVTVYDSCVVVARRCVATQASPAERDLPAGASSDLLDSVWRHEYSRHIRATAHIHRRSSALQTYLDSYRQGTPILTIARRPGVNFSPYLLARIIIEHELGLPSRDTVGALVKAPETIPDARLRAELAACIAADEHCGPRFDRLRAASGNIHEALLELALKVRRRSAR